MAIGEKAYGKDSAVLAAPLERLAEIAKKQGREDDAAHYQERARLLGTQK